MLLSHESIKCDVNLAKQTWLGVGGSAEYFYSANSEAELADIIRSLDSSIDVTVIGAGSNILIRDAGIKGLVVKLGGDLNSISIEDNIVTVGGAVKCPYLARYLLQHSLSNLEFIIGIPGTIGGSVFMNAGCYGYEIKDFIHQVHGIDKDGNYRSLRGQDIDFQYRKSNLPTGFIVTKADFICKPDAYESINKRITDISLERKANQPCNVRTVGSVFKNPSQCNKRAWQLIKEAGCHLFKSENVCLSDLHSNFIIHNGSGNSQEIEDFIIKIRDQVHSKTGVLLEIEVVFLG